MAVVLHEGVCASLPSEDRGAGLRQMGLKVAAHSAKCASGAECVFALMSSGRFEIKPVPAK
jgi:hypothetical protein